MRSGHGAENPILFYQLIYIFRFLLVSLNIEAILQEATIYKRREILSKMTPGLGLSDVYGATIKRIKVQGGDKSRLGVGALMWISHAEQPLKANQLCHALAIELGSTEFNSANIPSMTTLVSCCQGLITVDKEASTVRLIHFILKESFSSSSDIFSRPHSAMAEICLTYLNSQQVKALPWNANHRCSSFKEDYPFLRYCSLYWGVHANRDLSDCARSLALQLLQEFHCHISKCFLIDHIGTLDLRYYSHGFEFSGVQCASLFGIIELVAALIEIQGYGSKWGWYLGDSPLALAARNGHEEVVQMLVGWEGVDPDEPNRYGQTPLSYAAEHGRKGVVEILLGRAEVNLGRIDKLGRTPLSYAVGNGSEEVVMILLERAGVSSDWADNKGRTLLSHAAGHGQEAIVKMILGWEDGDVDRPDNKGRMPLSYAAREGHEGMVKMLLEREEVDPDKPANNGRTPLSYAAEEGHEGVVKILLEREEVDPDTPDGDGGTPLSRTAGCWNLSATTEVVVKLLLERKEINSDQPDDEGRAPLSHAAEVGFVGAMKILLGQEEVDHNEPEYYGRTPLSHAAGSQHGSAPAKALVKLLLERNEVKPD